jgi:eukaryotic-like serine/threonine-protein kinase
MVIGTFHYISPERLLGKTADGRADIWSLGCILYLLLTGRMPFPGDDPATLHRVIREAHEPLSTILSGYPPTLDHVIDRALAKDPDERYETAEEMSSDLEGINDDLKREHIGDVLASVRPMIEKEQWTSVRPVLLDLQRLNPQNTEVKKMLREVQEKFSRQQKAVQLRQLLSDAEEAVLTQRYAEALEFYKQADALDRGNAELAQKIEHVRGLKEKADKVASLLEQAREARRRSDFGAAGALIDKALQLDERNTDLRNERARIVQESERTNRERKRREFSDAARNQLAARQYTDAIKSLRSALEIDPTDSETQQLYQGAVERQEEQRRRKIIDQIAAEISESIADEDYERALALIQRAMEKLPGEAVLMQLKLDAESKQREKSAKKLVEKTSLEVYNLFLTSPQEALVIVQQALEQVPGEPRLIALQEKVLEQLRKASSEELKAQSLKQAQAAIDAKQFDQAAQILETAAIGHANDLDIASLLKYAQEQQRKAGLSRAVATATKQALPLIAANDFEAAIALLQTVAAQTGDASIEQLLRQATAGLTEYNRRLDAVLSRAQTLGATSTEQAVQLLSSQPQDIQRNARVQELRGRLDATREQERLAAQAKAAPPPSPLPPASLAAAQPDQPIEVTRPFQAAQVQAVQATQSFQPVEPTQSIQPSQSTQSFRPVPAFQPAQAASQPTAQVQTPVAPATAKSGKSLVMMIVVIVLVLLVVAGAGAGYWFFLRPAPAVPMGALEVNATPYAEVVSVTSDKGKALPLPTEDHWTPLRLDDVSTGSYTVVLRGPDGATQSRQCDVAQSIQVCTAVLKPIDDNAIEEIIGGAK